MGRPTTKIDTGGELDEDAPDVETGDAEDEDTGTEDEHEDTDDGNDAEDEGDDDDDDDEAEELDDAAFLASLTPAQRRAYDAKLSTANANGRKWRLRATGKDATWKRNPTPGDMPRKTPAPAKGAPAGVPDAAAIKAELVAELRAERQAEQVQTAAERELTAAGLVLPTDPAGRAAALARARKLLDLDGLEPGDVADEVAELRRTMPTLFAPARRGKARKSGVVGPVGTAPARRKRGAAPAGVADLFD